MAESTNAKPDLLGKILKLEREVRVAPNSPSRSGKPKKPGALNFGFGGPASAGSPLNGRRSRPANMGSWPVRNPSRVPPNSAEIEEKYNDIMKLSGIIDFSGEKVQCKIQDFDDLGELGHGTCGQVRKMKHKETAKVIAVKQMARTEDLAENKRIIMDLEVVIKSHDCPYIVQCLGIFINMSEVWICMELMTMCLDKLLKKIKRPIPERILGKIAVPVLRALNYLKETHGVIHRDIKPSNILLDQSGTVKLCDFGISGRLVDSKALTRTGTGCAAYMAPERIQPPNPDRPDYDIRADVWSLGISLVELASGQFPYRDCKSDFEVLSRVLNEIPPTVPSDYTDLFADFVSACLTKDYKQRPKYAVLLKHKFIEVSAEMEVDMAEWFASITKEIGGS